MHTAIPRATARHRFSTWFTILGLCVAMLAAGCADLRKKNEGKDEEVEDQKKGLTRSGALPVTFSAVEEINLLYLIDPMGETRRSWELSRQPRPWDQLELSEKYDLAFAQFARSYPGSELAARRNVVQNRLILASERRCGRYIQYLKKEQSDKNFQFGIASTLLAGVGALVPGARAAQNLSGSSAIVSGIRAEYNNEYFANLAVSVISRGITETRDEELLRLQQRQRLQYDSYDVAAAVADATRLDGLCNAVVGLEKANEAITKVSEPSQDAINRSLLRSQLTRALATNDTSDIDKLAESLKKIEKAGPGLVGGVLYPVLGAGAPASLAAMPVREVANLASVGDPYADALRTKRMILHAAESLPAQMTATLVGTKLADADVKAWHTQAGSIKDNISTSLQASFGKDNACLAEAEALTKKIQAAAGELRRSQLLQQTDGASADMKVRAGEAQLQNATDEATVFGRKLLRYQQALSERIDKLREAAKSGKKSAEAGTDFKWDNVEADVAATSRSCAAPKT